MKASHQALFDSDEKIKADLQDSIALNDIKSNKFYTDILMRCVDIQHKHLQHLAILLTETIKSLIKNNKDRDAKLDVQSHRTFILQQSKKIMQWVSKYEPQKMNVKDSTANELKRMNDYTKLLLTDLEIKEKLRNSRNQLHHNTTGVASIKNGKTFQEHSLFNSQMVSPMAHFDSD